MENRKAKQKAWRENNREELLQKKKEYYNNVYKETQLDRLMVDKILNPAKYLYKAAKYRAAKSGLEFTLTEEDVVIPFRCPALGIWLYPSFDKITDHSPSIDRIDNELGYTKDNIQVISNKANRMKNNASFEDIEKLYLHMKKTLNDKNNPSNSR